MGSISYYLEYAHKFEYFHIFHIYIFAANQILQVLHGYHKFNSKKNSCPTTYFYTITITGRYPTYLGKLDNLYNNQSL